MVSFLAWLPVNPDMFKYSYNQGNGRDAVKKKERRADLFLADAEGTVCKTQMHYTVNKVERVQDQGCTLEYIT